MWGRFRRSINIIDYVILMIIGLIESFIGLVNIRDSIGLMNFSIGLICISISIERFIILDNIEKELNRLMEKIETISPAEIINGNKKIYETAGELIETAEEIILATSFGEREQTPPEYIKKVADEISKKQQQRKDVVYRVVISIGKKSDIDRVDVFKKKGVKHLITQRYIDTKWGLDLLIVDGKHLLIAFPEFGESQKLQKAILFRNKPELVESIRRWYEDFLWKNSYDEQNSKG